MRYALALTRVVLVLLVSRYLVVEGVFISCSRRQLLLHHTGVKRSRFCVTKQDKRKPYAHAITRGQKMLCSIRWGSRSTSPAWTRVVYRTIVCSLVF